MLPLKHLIICMETRTDIVHFTKESQGKMKSLCLASQRDLCQHQVVESMRQVRGVTPGAAYAARVAIKKYAVFEREASSIWCLVSRGWTECRVRLKSLAGVLNEQFSAFLILLGWLYFAGYCAVESRFCQVVIFPLASVYSVFTSLVGWAQPNINAAIGIFQSDWNNLSWISTGGLI